MNLLQRDLQDLEGLYKAECEIIQKAEQLKKDIVFLHCPVKIGDIVKSNIGSFSPVDFKVESVWLENRYRMGGEYNFRAWGYIVNTGGTGEGRAQAFWHSAALVTEKNNG